MTIYVSYAVVGLAVLALLTAVVFRSSMVMAVEMISVMQITYFSVGFLDSMNPIYSGMLALRYLTGILTFNDV